METKRKKKKEEEKRKRFRSESNSGPSTHRAKALPLGLVEHTSNLGEILFLKPLSLILYFSIPHNTLCLPPKFCINHCF